MDRYYFSLIVESEKNPQTLLKKESEIKELLFSQPDYAPAHVAMGMIHLIRKDPDPAILAMREAIKNIKKSEAPSPLR